MWISSLSSVNHPKRLSCPSHVWQNDQDCSQSSPDMGPLKEDAASWCLAPFEPEGLLRYLRIPISNHHWCSIYIFSQHQVYSSYCTKRCILIFGLQFGISHPFWNSWSSLWPCFNPFKGATYLHIKLWLGNFYPTVDFSFFNVLYNICVSLRCISSKHWSSYIGFLNLIRVTRRDLSIGCWRGLVFLFVASPFTSQMVLLWCSLITKLCSPLLTLIWLLDIAIPLNKQLYSFSYVCFTAGSAGIVLSAFYVMVSLYYRSLSSIYLHCLVVQAWKYHQILWPYMIFNYWQIDVWGIRTPFLWLEWIGMNAMLVFVMAAQGIFPAFVNGWYYETPDNSLVCVASLKDHSQYFIKIRQAKNINFDHIFLPSAGPLDPKACLC